MSANLKVLRTARLSLVLGYCALATVGCGSSNGDSNASENASGGGGAPLSGGTDAASSQLASSTSTALGSSQGPITSSGGPGVGGSSAVGSGGAGGVFGSSSSSSSGSGGGLVALDPTAGHYRQTCDGSAAVYIDEDHFLDGNDETQSLSIYKRGVDGAPVQTKDISSTIDMSTDDEADIEDAERVGNRVYWITSHGRNKNGKLETSRYRFFAIDLVGAVPNVQLNVAGSYENLLQDLLVSANWATPDANTISLINNASQLSKSTAASLAPKDMGTNIEGLGALATPTYPQQLLIGLRNPHNGSKAIAITLLNPDQVIAGKTAQFGQSILLDLGGLGIRGLAWSPVHQSMLILGGPIDVGGPFRLFKWTGNAANTPVPVTDLTPPPGSASEGIVVFPDSKDVQIVFDQGSFQINGGDCKDADTSDQFFTDTIVHVD